MKFFSRNLLFFTLTAMLLTFFLRAVLSYIFINQNFLVINIWAFLYFALLIWAGWRLGSEDAKENKYFNEFFRYHLATFFSWTVISLLWFGLGYASEFEVFSHVTLPLLIWASCIVVHFIYLLLFKRKAFKTAVA